MGHECDAVVSGTLSGKGEVIETLHRLSMYWKWAAMDFGSIFHSTFFVENEVI